LPTGKTLKKVTKLEAQTLTHEWTKYRDEVIKIKQQIDAIWDKTRQAALWTWRQVSTMMA
jgi:hypothetical protein